MQHIDGPYYLLPFASVYRVLVAVTENQQIQTVLPMCMKTFTITNGDVLGFDFNREIHYIQNHPTNKNKGFRVVLKLH